MPNGDSFDGGVLGVHYLSVHLQIFGDRDTRYSVAVFEFHEESSSFLVSQLKLCICIINYKHCKNVKNMLVFDNKSKRE